MRSAEALLAAVEEARGALWDVNRSAHELLEAKRDVDAFVPIAVGRFEEYGATSRESGALDAAIPPSYALAINVITKFVELPGAHNPLDSMRRAEAGRLLDEVQDTLKALHEEAAPAELKELAPTLREFMRKQSRLMTAFQARGDTPPVFQGAMNRVHAAVAGVALSFPATGGAISEVGRRAERVKALLLEANQTINSAMQRESDPIFDATVTQAFAASNDEQAAFAVAANVEILKRRSFWKKYAD